MNAYNLLRAKSIKEEQPEDRNLLLKDHILQVIKRLEDLYAYTEENKSQISNPWINEEIKRKQLFLAITKGLFIHDLGKIDAGFQRKLFAENVEEDVWKELSKIFNWNKFPKQKIKRHEYLSIFWSCFLLNDEKEAEWNAKIRTAILFHHYNKFYTDSERELLEIIKNNQNASKEYIKFLLKYQNILKEFLKSAIEEVKKNCRYDFVKNAMDELESEINFEKLKDLNTSIEKHLPDIGVEIYDPETSEGKDETFILTAGILKRCDHSASAEIPIEELNNISLTFSKIEENIANSINKISKKEEDFWQKKILVDNASNYLLLVAPTGSGKTEFALLWAKKQQRKLIYTLPLRVALNDLFARFQDYANKNNSNMNENIVSLLHSTAFIEYLKQERSGTEGALIDQKVHTSKNLASPLILTTPDQVLLTSLNFHGADRLKSIYPFAAIVVDEIQAYDPEMAAIIIKSLQDIKKLGGNILVMTATYPPYFRTFLSGSKKTELDFKEIGPKNPQNIKNYNIKRHKVELIDASFELEKDDKETNKKSNDNTFKPSNEFKEKIESQIKVADKNILVICNNVRKAIEIYKFLKCNYSAEKHINILHSRLIEGVKKDRVNFIKDKIKEKLESRKAERVILVATQIVEASVDIDFDVIITEISPIDSQIQRWGRVFRNRIDKEGNPLDYKDNESNVIIFKRSNKITNLIYDKYTIDKTIECLDEKNKEGSFSNPLTYEDEKKLVEHTFDKVIEKNGEKITLKTHYEEEIEYLINQLEYFSIEKKSEAQRMFRKIAGLSFVFPDIMEIDVTNNDEQSELKKEFASIIRDKKNKDISWKEIISKIRERIPHIDDDKKLMWCLRELLYHYSINIPLYHSDRKQDEGNYVYNHEFKGFYVSLTPDKHNRKEVLEMGIDKIEDIDDSYKKEFGNSYQDSSNII